jgi:hypothetical protein
MKWKNHTAIARAISKEMGLSDELERALCSGSVEPDKRPDLAYRVSKGGRTYIGRAPHHHPPTGTIMAYVWRARRAYLEGNDYWAVKSLGRALHYVQDKSVHTGFRGWKHDAREEDLADLEPPRAAVLEGIDRAVCSPRFVRECILAVRPRRDSRDALYQATLFSSAIFASVIAPPDAEERFVADYNRRVRSHRLKVAVAGGIVAVSVLGAFLLQQPLLAAGAAAGVAIVGLDLGYYRVRREGEWFGLH